MIPIPSHLCTPGFLTKCLTSTGLRFVVELYPCHIRIPACLVDKIVAISIFYLLKHTLVIRVKLFGDDDDLTARTVEHSGLGSQEAPSAHVTFTSEKAKTAASVSLTVAMADPTTVYSLALLAEYTHSLDSLPLDLSRNFADLRELDAVLSSSMSLITSKINQLTKMIEDRTASPEDRLWLLTEIGDEANRLKLGGEDKIRVASAAADNLRNHKNHLIDLLHYLPNFDPSVLNRTTYYPHVTSKSYPPHSVETGRRQRRGGNLTGNRNNDGNNYYQNDPNPPKKKRGGGRDDDVEGGPNRTPRKERVIDMSNGRPRNTGRGGGGGRRYVRR